MAGTGPSESFLSSYFRNPFKKKKGEDINLPGGPRHPRLPRPKGTSEHNEEMPKLHQNIMKGYGSVSKLMKKKEKK